MALFIQSTLIITAHVFLRYVPKYVYENKWFWVLLAITIVGIFIYHNAKRHSKKTTHGAKKLTYQNKGREGVVIYSDEISSINFHFEFGGGDCITIISVPAAADWKNETNRSLEERSAIIEFVAKQTLNDHVGGGRYVITENFIELYK